MKYYETSFEEYLNAIKNMIQNQNLLILFQKCQKINGILEI